MGGIYWGDPDSFQNSGMDQDDLVSGVGMMVNAMAELGYKFDWYETITPINTNGDNNKGPGEDEWLLDEMDLVTVGIDNDGEFDERTPDWIRYGNFDYVSDMKGTLAEYNAKHGTNYTYNNIGGQYYYNTTYRPQREELMGAIYSGQTEAAGYIMEGALWMAPLPKLGILRGAVKSIGKFYQNIKIARAFRVVNPNTLNKVTQGVFEYSQPMYSALSRAPKGGTIVNGTFYKGGQILPFPRIQYGRGSQFFHSKP